MSDAAMRAREIAAALMSGQSGQKRKFDGGFSGSSEPSSKRARKVVYVPTEQFPGINFLGVILGPRGSSHKALENETGCKILIRGKGTKRPGSAPEEGDDLPMHTVILGPNDEAVSSAEAKLKKILFNPHALKQQQLQALGSSRFSGSNNEKVINIPNKHVGMIIGKGGETIKRIQAQAGCRMFMQPNQEVQHGAETRTVTLQGGPSQIADAEKMINDIISKQESFGGGSSNSSNGNYSIVLPLQVPNFRVGLIIGKGGQTVKAINRVTGAHIQIPSQPDVDNPEIRTITISANSTEVVKHAQREIQKIVDNDSDSIAQKGAPIGSIAVNIDVPNTIIGLVIGKGGETIKGIQSRTNTSAKIPTECHPGVMPPVRRVMVSGHTKQTVDMAVAQIMAIMNGTPSHMIAQIGAQSSAFGMPQTGFGGPGGEMANMYQAAMRESGMNQYAYQNQGYAQPQQNDLRAQWRAYYESNPEKAVELGYDPATGDVPSGKKEEEKKEEKKGDYSKQWEEYYRKDPKAAVAAGYEPSAKLKAEVEGGANPAEQNNPKPAEEDQKKEEEKGEGEGEGEVDEDEAHRQWEAYYRSNPEDAIKRGYVPSDALRKEVEGK